MITEHKIIVNIQIEGHTVSQELVSELKSLVRHDTIDFEKSDKLLRIKERPYVLSEISKKILNKSGVGTVGFIEHTIEIKG